MNGDGQINYWLNTTEENPCEHLTLLYNRVVCIEPLNQCTQLWQAQLTNIVSKQEFLKVISPYFQVYMRVRRSLKHTSTFCRMSPVQLLWHHYRKKETDKCYQILNSLAKFSSELMIIKLDFTRLSQMCVSILHFAPLW